MLQASKELKRVLKANIRSTNGYRVHCPISLSEHSVPKEYLAEKKITIEDSSMSLPEFNLPAKRQCASFIAQAHCTALRISEAMLCHYWQVTGQHRNDAMCLWIILLVQCKEVASASSLAGWPSCFLSLIFKFNVICLCEQLLTTLKLSGGGHTSVGAGSIFKPTVVPLFSHVYFLGCKSSVLSNTSVFCLIVQSISSSLSLITSSHCLILCHPQMCFSFLGTQCYSNRQLVTYPMH